MLSTQLGAGKPCCEPDLQRCHISGTGPAGLGPQALTKAAHLSAAGQGADSMGKVNSHRPQLSASSQGPSRTSVMAPNQTWAGDSHGCGR